MKKLCCLIVIALAALIAVPAVIPVVAAVAEAREHREFVEIVVGPFEHEHRAHEEAERLQDRGFHTEVYHVHHEGWKVRAWRRD
jgi:hypothetical protein